MRKKILLIFLVVVAILFVTINIRDYMQRPFHRERVNNFITAAKDLIQKNEQLEITEIGEGGRMKGGGWGNHIRFKSNLSEEKTVELIIPPLQAITGNEMIGKVSDSMVTSYQFGFAKFAGNLFYNGPYDGNWELSIISQP